MFRSGEGRGLHGDIKRKRPTLNVQRSMAERTSEMAKAERGASNVEVESRSGVWRENNRLTVIEPSKTIFLRTSNY